MTSNKYTKRDLDLQRLTNKKVNELSTFLGIDSGPSTQLIANIQSRINNPIFKLSINDYEVMCGNNMLINMMSKVLDCDVNQFKQFCKYINVFAENIKLSPESIKKKMKITKSINASNRRGSMNLLPDDIYYSIVNKYKTIFNVRYALKDWIPLNKLKKEILSENPNAVDFLKENRKLIDWKALCRNPNPEAIALLIENKDDISDYYDLLFNNISSVTHNKAITNPAAIEYIKDVLNRYPNQIEWNLLSKNPSAIELIKDKIRKETLHQNDIVVEPELLHELDELDELDDVVETHYRKKIDWWALSQNPNAMELLKANSTKIYWNGLSANTNLKAIELLKDKIYAENLINQDVLDNLNPSDKIDWWALSQNTNAIELLKRNIDKINWALLSKNPNQEAIKLLKANPTKIDWDYLSENSNSGAIELLKANPAKINLYRLAQNPNPNAVELLKNFEHKTQMMWDFLNANPSIFEAVLE